MSDWYILNDHNEPVEVDMLEGARWFERNRERRIVQQTDTGKGKVSTVFLGLDHAHGGEPLLFETMVFGGPLADEMERYSTWSEAVAGHDQMVARVRDHA